jgi:mannonate dehydratase
MNLGLGLYRHMLTPDNFRFAKQAGATHIVAHLVDYFASGPRIPHSQSAGYGWGITRNQGKLWTVEELTALRQAIEAEGLTLAAVENLDPSHWHDVLLDGPLRDRQLEDVKTIVRNLGAAGIPVLGYNFSVAGVWGHVVGPWARGAAESVGFSAETGPAQTPIPNGHVWNMTYDPDAASGEVPETTTDQLWARLQAFLQAVVPVAEEAGGPPRRPSGRPAPADAAWPRPPRQPAGALPKAARPLPESGQRP